jgi:hypothetical protein
MSLVHPRPRLPAWEKLPDKCRDEIVLLLAQLIREHVRTVLGAGAKGQFDE